MQFTQLGFHVKASSDASPSTEPLFSFVVVVAVGGGVLVIGGD